METKAQIMAKVASHEYDAEKAMQLLDALEGDELFCKVANKSGGMSLYGLMRFPLTLGKKQWRKLRSRIDGVLQLIAEHEGEMDAIVAARKAKGAADEDAE